MKQSVVYVSVVFYALFNEELEGPLKKTVVISLYLWLEDLINTLLRLQYQQKYLN